MGLRDLRVSASLILGFFMFVILLSWWVVGFVGVLGNCRLGFVF